LIFKDDYGTIQKPNLKLNSTDQCKVHGTVLLCCY